MAFSLLAQRAPDATNTARPRTWWGGQTEVVAAKPRQTRRHPSIMRTFVRQWEGGVRRAARRSSTRPAPVCPSGTRSASRCRSWPASCGYTTARTKSKQSRWAGPANTATFAYRTRATASPPFGSTPRTSSGASGGIDGGGEPGPMRRDSSMSASSRFRPLSSSPQIRATPGGVSPMGDASSVTVPGITTLPLVGNHPVTGLPHPQL